MPSTDRTTDHAVTQLTQLTLLTQPTATDRTVVDRATVDRAAPGRPVVARAVARSSTRIPTAARPRPQRPARPRGVPVSVPTLDTAAATAAQVRAVPDAPRPFAAAPAPSSTPPAPATPSSAPASLSASATDEPVVLRPGLPAASRDLLAGSARELLGAVAADEPETRYARAHLAALRAAAAVLAARARPRGRRSGGVRSAWVLLAEVAPELGEWAAFFAAGAGKRAAAEAGLAGVVSEREADDLVREVETFLALVARTLGVGHQSVLDPRVTRVS